MNLSMRSFDANFFSRTRVMGFQNHIRFSSCRFWEVFKDWYFDASDYRKVKCFGLIFVMIEIFSTIKHIGWEHAVIRCRPSKERRCIPDVAIKNEGSIVEAYRNVNMHVYS